MKNEREKTNSPADFNSRENYEAEETEMREILATIGGFHKQRAGGGGGKGFRTNSFQRGDTFAVMLGM